MSNDSGCYIDGPPRGLLNDSTGKENPSGQTFLYRIPDMSDYDNNVKGAGFQILAKQKRRLPMPPSLPPPRKNFAQRIMPISNFCTQCCGYSRLIVATILVVMALVSLSVVIYLVVRNQKPPDPHPFISTTVVALSTAYVAQDFPEDPLISMPKGFIGNRSSEMQCHASTGCQRADMTIEVKDPNEQKYLPWRSTPTKYQAEHGGIWQTMITLNFSIEEVNHILDNKSFQCIYSIGVTKYKSTPLLMKLVPAGYCNNKIIGCSYPHPYDCNKFITCTSFPEEKTCGLGLYFQKTIDCSGVCVWTNQANCEMG